VKRRLDPHEVCGGLNACSGTIQGEAKKQKIRSVKKKWWKKNVRDGASKNNCAGAI
jgi:hypothetical protein